jgi:hypothetical protein
VLRESSVRAKCQLHVAVTTGSLFSRAGTTCPLEYIGFFYGFLFLFFDVILSWLMGVKVKLDLWLEDEPGAGFLHRSVGSWKRASGSGPPSFRPSAAWSTERKKPKPVNKSLDA